MVVMLQQLLNLSSVSSCMACFNKHEKLIYLTSLFSGAKEKERNLDSVHRLSHQISIGGWQFNFAAHQSLIQIKKCSAWSKKADLLGKKWAVIFSTAIFNGSRACVNIFQCTLGLYYLLSGYFKLHEAQLSSFCILMLFRGCKHTRKQGIM